MDASPASKPADFVDSPAAMVEKPVEVLPAKRCDLCGEILEGPPLRFSLVSPWAPEERLSVCRICGRAARGEGYRPAA
jgi:hypothetical protein